MRVHIHLLSVPCYDLYLFIVICIFPADTLTSDLIVNAEFNVRSKPDCGGTAYENQNRSWFYFSIFGGEASRVCKINVVNMNKQAKLYTQGMQPVMRVGEGPSAKWERIREPVTHFVII